MTPAILVFGTSTTLFVLFIVAAFFCTRRRQENFSSAELAREWAVREDIMGYASLVSLVLGLLWTFILAWAY